MQGKVAQITRSLSGIGQAVCYYFAQEGATIAFTYVKGEEEEDAQDTLPKIKELKTDEGPRAIEEITEDGRLVRMHAPKHGKEGSSIINTTSVQAYPGSPSSLEYQSTKGAIVAFTGGLVTTLGSVTPMDRAAQPHEIATSYVFLASQDSSYYAVQVLYPNGGMIVNG
ncbi:unnamed protein product [Fraxinus pennsylvanica]|uniref:Uncharacterized protein n=1 Tax=Fraxinus pennsylvanica TaxID=56036 RepID=A0AAD1ZW61_9LAMI|nr:unnamed protein product [Fraxinus pennsylvanica]